MTEPPSAATIRAARPADASRISDLIEPFVRAGKLLPRTRTEIDELIPTSFVAEAEGRLVGFAVLEVYSKKLAEIRSLAVAENRQNLGLGSLLVGACVDLARRRQVLEVMVVTSSEDFFRGCGFNFTLPGEKKALFIQPAASEDRASSQESSP